MGIGVGKDNPRAAAGVFLTGEIRQAALTSSLLAGPNCSNSSR
ncbi:hypothetical protein ABZ379_25255 [Streptomyces canus]